MQKFNLLLITATGNIKITVAYSVNGGKMEIEGAWLPCYTFVPDNTLINYEQLKKEAWKNYLNN